jgi:hypothetical protein
MTTLYDRPFHGEFLEDFNGCESQTLNESSDRLASGTFLPVILIAISQVTITLTAYYMLQRNFASKPF